MELSFDLLRTFLAVVDTGNFTMAGEQVHLTQSAVSMQIKRLTEAVGRPLFHIQGRSVRLSVTGELLVGHAKKILQTHKDACTALSRPDLIGRVRLGSPEDYTALFLPRILAGFADVHPNVQVTLTCEPTPRLVALLNKCELDIAILTAADGNAGRPVHRERVVWVASKDGAALKRDPLPLALYNYNSIYRQWAEKMLVHSGINYCTAFLSPSISGILAAVRAGSAVAPVGRSIVPTDLRVVGEEQGLPELPQANVTLRQSLQDEAPLLACLAEQIEAAFSLISPGDCAG